MNYSILIGAGSSTNPKKDPSNDKSSHTVRGLVQLLEEIQLKKRMFKDPSGVTRDSRPLRPSQVQVPRYNCEPLFDQKNTSTIFYLIY